MTSDPTNTDPTARYDSAHAGYHGALTSQPVELVSAVDGHTVSTYPNVVLAMAGVLTQPEKKRASMFLRFMPASAKTASAA